MSWIFWIFVLVGLYFLIFPVRAIIQVVLWFLEQYMAQRIVLRDLKGKSLRRTPEVRPKVASDRLEGMRKGDTKETARSPVKSSRQVRRPSGVRRFLKLLKIKVFKRGYEYWVAAALSEDDLAIKVEYLSKALRLNPTYLVALGMKGYALLDLKRYEEALECLDKCVEESPGAVTWYKRGICCYHLKMRDEAIRCFSRVIDGYVSPHRRVLDDALRMMKLLEDEVRSTETSAAVTQTVDPPAFQDSHEAEDAQPKKQSTSFVQTAASLSSDMHADKRVM